MDDTEEALDRFAERRPGWSRDVANQFVRASTLFERGTFLPGSVNARAIVACLPLNPRLSDGTVLKGYQVEDVLAMRSMERNTHVPLRLPSGETLYHNVGILGEPPGSGSMLTVIAHLMSSGDRAPSPDNTYFAWLEDEDENTKKRRLASDEYSYGTVVPPTNKNIAPGFCGATLIVCTPFGADAWSRKIGEVAPNLRLLVVARHTDMARLSQHDLIELHERDGWVIIVSVTMYGAFHDVYGGLRFSRLIIDDASSLTGKYLPRTKACFTWLVESSIEMYLLPWALAPDQRARPISYDRVCSVLRDAGLEDLSRVVIRHPLVDIVRECEMEFPLHIHYECSETGCFPHRRHGRSWEDYAELRPLELSGRSERERTLTMTRIGAELCADVVAASRGTKKDARARIAGWREDTCSVCWGNLAGEGRPCAETCIMGCCSQLLCFDCIAKISTSPAASCPVCRADIAESGVKVLTDSPIATPSNLSIHRSEYWNRPLRDTLSAVLNAMATGSRVVLWTFAQTHHLNIPHLSNFVERHGFASCRALHGSKYQIASTLCKFNNDRDAIDATKKKAVYLTAAREGRGCSLRAATDVIFLSEVSTSVYQHVMARVLNAANPTIRRRAGVLRVHILHCRGTSYPELLLSRDGMGMGADPERYAATIARCKETAGVAFAGRRRHYLWPVDIDAGYGYR